MLFKYSYLDWLLGRVHFALTLPSSSVTVTSSSGTSMWVRQRGQHLGRPVIAKWNLSLTSNIEFFSGQFLPLYYFKITKVCFVWTQEFVHNCVPEVLFNLLPYHSGKFKCSNITKAVFLGFLLPALLATAGVLLRAFLIRSLYGVTARRAAYFIRIHFKVCYWICIWADINEGSYWCLDLGFWPCGIGN